MAKGTLWGSTGRLAAQGHEFVSHDSTDREFTMTDDRSMVQVHEGMDVLGSDGEKLGSVDRIEGSYIVASKGFFFPTDYYIPTSAIASVDGEQAYLNVTKDAALDQGWDTQPMESDDAMIYDDQVGTRDPFATDDVATQPVDDRAYGRETTVNDSDTIRVPLSEEELTATKRTVDRGAVQIEKDVIEEEQTLEVPVTEERVNVTRRTVDRDVTAGETTFEGGTIEVPVRGEEVDVEKRARVTEELEISKEAVQDTQRVTDTVRREEARVDDTTMTEDVNDTTRRGRNS